MRRLFEERLRTAGQSITTPRLVVFDYLVGRGPVAINEVMVACLPRADRASIYRTLEVFRRLEIISELTINGQRAIELGEDYSGHHHHLSCSACGKSLDIIDVTIERRLDRLAEQYGFLITGHQLEVSGLCSTCR